jgi:hypothetical protein
MFAALFYQPPLSLAAETEAVAMEGAVGIDGFRAAKAVTPEPVRPVDQSGMAESNEAVPSLHSSATQPDLSCGVAGDRLGCVGMLELLTAGALSSATDPGAHPAPPVETGATPVVSGVGADLPAPPVGATRASAPFDEPGDMLVGTAVYLQKNLTRLAESPAEVVKHTERDAAPMPGAPTVARGTEKVDAVVPLTGASVSLAGAGVIPSGQERDAEPTGSFVQESKLERMNAFPTERQQVKPVAPEKDLFGKTPEGSLAMGGLAGQLPAAATLMPVSTEAERLWLGRLNWQASPFPGAGRGPTERVAVTAVTEPEAIEAQERSPSFGMATEPESARLLGIVALAGDLANSSPFVEADQVIMNWTPAGQPALQGSQAVGPLHAATLPQLAAGIIATLHQQADGTTVIALSPDELGSVRLRLEADVQNPERMIVHLIFDRPETMDLFRRHADQLSDAIRTAGYAEARLDFGQQGTGEDARSGQGPDDRGNALAANETDPGTTAINPVPPVPNRPAHTAGLDLRL